MAVTRFYYVEKIQNLYVTTTMVLNLDKTITKAEFLENPPIIIDETRLKITKAEADALAAELNTPPE